VFIKLNLEQSNDQDADGSIPDVAILSGSNIAQHLHVDLHNDQFCSVTFVELGPTSIGNSAELLACRGGNQVAFELRRMVEENPELFG
jgi:hypothetical protein